ncbi:MAG TPA: c-type cytochrome, partial [Kiloniellales bacterium]|nr:c-type cytochrome [Kiloniellales bacterium]
SDAAEEMAAEGVTWTYDNLATYLENPRDFMPGTRMVFPGLSSLEERAAVIALLREQSDDPLPLSTDEAAPAEEAAEEEVEADAEAVAEEEGEAAAAEAPEEAEAEPAEAAASAGDSELLAAIAAADPAEGEGVSRRCAACHTFEEGGPNRVGPNLWNVVGGPVAHLDGFNYSDAAEEMAAEGVTWTYDNLATYLENPRDFMPGTRMVFPGLRSLEDRAAMIAYMRSMSDDPPPLE